MMRGRSSMRMIIEESLFSLSVGKVWMELIKVEVVILGITYDGRHLSFVGEEVGMESLNCEREGRKKVA